MNAARRALRLNPQVSVVIPTRNRATVLARAMESVVNQTFPQWELIVVDDGSDDGSGRAIGSCPEDPRVRYHRTAHRGVSAARNVGLALARGEWFAFLDSDDVWMPAKLEKQLSCVGATGDKVCHTDEIWLRRGLRVNPMKKHSKPAGWIFERCLPLCVLSPSSVMLHRSVLDVTGPFDESYVVCEDYDLWLRVAARYRVSLVAEKLVMKFGGEADQLSRRFWGMDRWRARALYSQVCSPNIPRNYRAAAYVEMRRKLDVLRLGYARRGRSMEMERLEAFLEAVRRWWRLVAEGAPRAELPPEFPALFDSPDLDGLNRACGVGKALED
ncbi:MAG: glycosyltransferase family 2 protein [Acidobacteria bacterium]|nr:glycosyltransferase family 2 protein [Acidobacteriota bacterium]